MDGRRFRAYAIKSLLAAIFTSVLAWPVWVTKNLYEIKTDIVLIRQGIERIALVAQVEPKRKLMLPCSNNVSKLNRPSPNLRRPVTTKHFTRGGIKVSLFKGDDQF